MLDRFHKVFFIIYSFLYEYNNKYKIFNKTNLNLWNFICSTHDFYLVGKTLTFCIVVLFPSSISYLIFVFFRLLSCFNLNGKMIYKELLYFMKQSTRIEIFQNYYQWNVSSILERCKFSRHCMCKLLSGVHYVVKCGVSKAKKG
jgi:hypothetical protein